MSKFPAAILLTVLTASPLLAVESPATLPELLAAREHDAGSKDKAAGRIAGAARHYEQALRLWNLAGERYLASKSVTLMNLGEIHRQQSRFQEALAELNAAFTLSARFQKQLPEPYAEALSRLGALYGQIDQTERGRALLKQSIQLFRALKTEQNAELAYACNALGMLDFAAGDLTAAELSLKQAVNLSEFVYGPAHSETLNYQTNLALLFIVEKQFERAEALLRRVKFAADPASENTRALLPSVFAELSAASLGRNKLSIAEEYALAEIAAAELQAPPDPLILALAQVSLAGIYIREGKPAEAEAILPRAVEAERALSAKKVVLADGVRRLADLRAMQRSWTEAASLYREALDLYETTGAPGRKAMVPILRDYAAVLKRGGGSRSEAKSAEMRAKALTKSIPPA